VKKKTVKKSTMFNMKGILILTAFGIWVNLIIGISKNYESLKDAILALSGNTFFIVIVTYILLVILGIFVEGENTDSFT